MSILEHGSVKDWLSECRAFRTRRTYEVNIKRFFAWYGRPVDEFLKLDPKDMRHLALKYQNENESLKRKIGRASCRERV